MSIDESLPGGIDTASELSKPVLIADAGAQYVDVIYWQLVKRGYRSEIVHFTRRDGPLDSDALIGNYSAAIYTGSGDSVNDEGAPEIPPVLLEDMNSLGICYGAQAIAKALGGVVGKAEIDGHQVGEYGETFIDINPGAVIYRALAAAKKTKVLMSHFDSVLTLPKDFHETGKSGEIIASYESNNGKISATQFHPEVAETDNGVEMIVQFLKNAGVEPDPNYNVEVALGEYMDREEASIADKLESGAQIRGFLSGGVDSRVACEAVVSVAKLLGRLDQVKFYYVNTGHNRIEDDTIIEQMQSEGMPVELIDATDEFFDGQVEVITKAGETIIAGPLTQEANPEIKRLIIGNMFKKISLRIMEEAQGASELPVYFVQGTNQSDIIESGGLGGKQIKGHHNIEAMEKLRAAGILIEPMRGLMKYHVRALGEHRYGLPEKVFKRQPFPGVGNSPRIIVNPMGEFDPTDPKSQQRLDTLLEVLSGGKLKGHLVNMKTVGAQGDDRSLKSAVFLEGESDWELLDKISIEIAKKLTMVNRFFFVSGKQLVREDIHGVTQFDDRNSTQKLNKMEEIHRKTVEDTFDIAAYLSQYFVASLPVSLIGDNQPTLAIRHFITGENLKSIAARRTAESEETFRTGIASIPGKHVDLNSFDRLVKTLYDELEGYGSVVYDITGKPPGSTEFE